jgi:DNA (cytosine-5)-methyltransferase 1
MTRFGVPQRRRRHVLVGVLGGDEFDIRAFVSSLPDNSPIAGDVLAGIEDEPEIERGAFFQTSRMTKENQRRVAHLFRHDAYDLPDRLRPPCHRDKRHTYRSMYGRMRWEQPAQTITSGFGSMGQGRFVHPSRPRTLTPHEAARLQGFPDFFDFSPCNAVTALREMIGNAVPPQLSATVVSELINRAYL